MDEDGRRFAETAPPGRGAGRLERHLCGGRVQLGAIANLGSDVSLMTWAGGGGPLPGAPWQGSSHRDSPQHSLP